MSTLGGSRGERHAKPKFSALDINSLYRTSRVSTLNTLPIGGLRTDLTLHINIEQGESIEPSAAKNAAPRKHGMQSLGKVPSARRPPANLPSLKAETTSSPADQTTGATNTSAKQSKSAAAAVAAGTSAAKVTAAAAVAAHAAGPLALSSSSSSSAAAVAAPSSNSSNSVSNTLSTPQQQSQQQQQPQHHQLLSNSNNNNGSWSSVANRHIAESAAPQPPAYQSPQFQHEFPSLDGAPVIGGKASKPQQQLATGDQQRSGPGTSGGGDYHDGNGPHISLRPHGDANWMQQQQQQGAGSAAHQQGQDLQLEPPQCRALMPSFMFRGGAAGASGGSPAMSQQQSTGYGAGNGGGQFASHHPQNLAKQRQQMGGPMAQHHNAQNNNHNGGNNGNYDNGNNANNNYNSYRRDEQRGGGGGNYHQQQQQQHGGRRLPPHHQQRGGGRGNDPRTPHDLYTETDEVVLQRPIIKEEELKRIDAIASDDGWAHADEIDYNQKLTFSDDENDADSGSSGHVVYGGKGQQQSSNKGNDKKRREEEQRAGKFDHIERFIFVLEKCL